MEFDGVGYVVSHDCDAEKKGKYINMTERLSLPMHGEICLIFEFN